MGKHGVLKGNSGLSFDEDGKFVMHMNASYDNNGMVFVEDYHKDNGMWWKRMTLKRALREKKEIIKCCQCDKPATSLDHLWPYHTGRCLCDDHDYKPEYDQ